MGVILGVGQTYDIDASMDVEIKMNFEAQIKNNALSHVIDHDNLGRARNTRCWTMKTEFDQDLKKCPDLREGHCVDQPIKMSDHPKCNGNEIFWHFCDYKCHCDNEDMARQHEISAIVAKFDCDKLLETEYFPENFLNETTCQIPKYEHPSWVVCHCRESENPAAIATLSISGTLFLLIKFGLYFWSRYNKSKTQRTSRKSKTAEEELELLEKNA